jgi:hypothetical protein
MPSLVGVSVTGLRGELVYQKGTVNFAATQILHTQLKNWFAMVVAQWGNWTEIIPYRSFSATIKTRERSDVWPSQII